MDGTGDMFEPFIRANTNNLRIKVIRYPVDSPLTYLELEDFVMHILPKQEPYVLLGESFSGPLAISIAAKQPLNLKGLILCATFARNPLPALHFCLYIIDFLPFALPPFAIVEALLLGQFSTLELSTALKKTLNKVSTSVLKMRLKAVLDVDVTEQLKTISIPVLYLSGQFDRLIPESAGKLLAELHPTMAKVSIASPHYLLQTKPDDAWHVILTWLLKNAVINKLFLSNETLHGRPHFAKHSISDDELV
jgi:pimeloyl-ACP methyl ester carboxylesterase